MSEYFLLCKFTEKGISHIKDSPDRVAKVKKLFEENGGKVKCFHIVLGHYDTVVHVEAPDDETIAKLSLAIGREGNVKIETLRAFTLDQFIQIVSELA